MFNYTAFIKAIVIAFRQSISIIFFNSILFCVSSRFTSLTILAKVIVINLAIFFDNALQAGFFFDDAAVEPIGIISDAVNTGNVALEYALSVKDAACFFRCSIGDQRRDSGSCVSGFGVQIVGIAVNDCPACLLQLAVLVVLPAVHIRKPAVPELPLGIKSDILGYGNRSAVFIHCASAIGIRVPTDEIVALTGKGVGIQGSVHTDFKALRLHTALAAVGIEGDGVELTGSCRVLCRINDILFSNHNLRAPAGEGVAVVLVRSLICAALEGRHGALQTIFLIYDLTINYPSDMCASLRNFLALFQQFLADRAVGVAGVTGRSAGGVLGTSHLSDRMAASPLGVEGGVRRQGDVGAICIGGAGAVGFGSPTREIVALAGERVGEQRRSRGGRNLLHLDLLCAGVVRIKDHQKALALEPLVNLEVILILRLTFGGRIASVVIFQSDRVDTDIMSSYVRVDLCILIGARLGARGRLHNIAAGLLAGAYVRTVFCGVDRAGRNERTVDIHKGVHQISIGARMAFRGRI